MLFIATPPRLCFVCLISAGIFLPIGGSMEYTKPSLTYEEQADLLISRGLLADRDILIATLQNVNYYRLVKLRNPPALQVVMS